MVGPKGFKGLKGFGFVLLLMAACNRAPSPSSAAPAGTSSGRPSILLITLDTTRADAIGPEAAGVQTPAFNAVAARGRRFRQAYATVPETLPSHSAMMTGLYPGGHGVHENARYLGAEPAGRRRAAATGGLSHRRVRVVVRAVAALRPGARVRRLRRCGRRGERAHVERTTDAALTELARRVRQAALRVGPFLRRALSLCAAGALPQPLRQKPYLGEVAAMDEQIGRLVQAFEQRASRTVRHRHRGRSRRRTRRPRRGAARRPPVPVDDPRAAGDRRAGRRPRRERHAGQHAPDFSHAPRLGRARRRA